MFTAHTHTQTYRQTVRETYTYQLIDTDKNMKASMRFTHHYIYITDYYWYPHSLMTLYTLVSLQFYVQFTT